MAGVVVVVVVDVGVGAAEVGVVVDGVVVAAAVHDSESLDST